MYPSSLKIGSTYVYKRRGWLLPSLLSFLSKLDEVNAYLFTDTDRQLLVLSSEEVQNFVGNCSVEDILL